MQKVGECTLTINRFNVFFDNPEHGWLPVTMQFNGEELELDVSDVPVNPICELISALLDISESRSKKITWFLEPVECELTFTVTGDFTTLELSLNDKSLDYSIEIETNVMLLTFWRALRKFETFEVKDHWEIPKQCIAELTLKINEIKKETAN